jgi:hypothetical protein
LAVSVRREHQHVGRGRHNSLVEQSASRGQDTTLNSGRLRRADVSSCNCIGLESASNTDV